MTGVLAAITAGARRSAEGRAATTPLAAVERAALARSAGGERFRASLAAEGLRVIAECKRRSPSKGILRSAYDPAAIARGYAAAGAAAISVLTEPSFFDGELAHLTAVRAAVDVPLLRKDFVVTEYQIAEARACGADGVLLIAAALAPPDLARLHAYAEALDLMPLVEIHDLAELDAALTAGARVVGVNSRDLRTLAVDTARFAEAIAAIPDSVIAVAESGLRAPADLTRWRGEGYDAFLVGERLMTAPDPGAALAALVGAAAGDGAA